jgi:hypothetical protein
MVRNLFEGRLTAYVAVPDKEAFAKMCEALGVSQSARIGVLVAQDIAAWKTKQARAKAAAAYDGVAPL